MSVVMMEYDPILDALIDLALSEDLGTGDLTTELCVNEERQITAHIIAKSDLVVSGIKPFNRVFEKIDKSVALDWSVDEGAVVASGTTLVRLAGNARSLLIGERVALNFLGRLSGIASQAYEWSLLVKEAPRCRLVDTRKTTPGWRALEKAAVKAGGGGNHRMGLFDGILIKENHIAAAGSLENAIERAQAGKHHLTKVEVETTNLDEVQRAVALGVDGIMLDNMDNQMMAEAISLIRNKSGSEKKDIMIEASGNMTPDRLASVAALGVDLISMGALTHSVASADVSMRFQWQSDD